MAKISSQIPVLVAGAGPTGLSLAIELQRQGVRCRVIDKAPSPARESRALAIQPRTLEMLAGMGLASEFLSRGKRVRGVHLYSGGHAIARVAFDTLDTPYPFVLSLPQNETEEILSSHVTIQRQVSLTGFSQESGSITAHLKHANGEIEDARCTWLAGCDGAHSVTRKTAGIGFEGEEFPEAFILADVAIEWDLTDDEFQVFFHPDGLFATFAFGGGRYRIIASKPPAGTSDPPTLADIQAISKTRGIPGMRVSGPRWITQFRIHHRMVSAFRKDRVFLLGDAAHIHSPAGGQGMNTGIQDACNLAWKLGLVESGRADAKLLDSYDAERRPVARAVLEATTLVTNMAATHSRFLEYVRDHLAPLVTSVAHRRIARNVAQLAVNYRRSPIVEDHHVHGGGRHAGDRWPAVFPGPGHTLLVPRGLDLKVLLDPFAEHLSVLQSTSEHAAIYLIRPDGYVAFRGDSEALFAYLDRLLPRAKL